MHVHVNVIMVVTDFLEQNFVTFPCFPHQCFHFPGVSKKVSNQIFGKPFFLGMDLNLKTMQTKKLQNIVSINVY